MNKVRSARELEQEQKNLEYGQEELRVFIADIIPDELGREEMEDRMKEVENLVNTF